MHMISRAIAAAMVLSSLGTAAYAAPVNLVTNGDFSSSSYTANSQFGTGYTPGGKDNQGVTNWIGNNGYDIYFTSAAKSTTQNVVGQYSYTGNEKLWAATASPISGGAFVALDGDSTPGVAGSISQSITGLVVGSNYQLDFQWAAAQVQSRTGATTEQFAVTLGTQKISTAVKPNPSQGFTGWFHETFTYTATAAAETLTFLSIGTPSGLPPIAALDDVSLVAVPEPASLALFGFGLLGIYAVRRRLS